MARRAYSGPVYPHPIRTVNDLDNAMAWLVDQGRLPGARSGNSPTNVGETIEAALGQPPSTTRLDFVLDDGRRELKSGRQKLTNPDTLASRVLNTIDGAPYIGRSKSARYAALVREFAIETQQRINNAIEGQPVKALRRNLYVEVNHNTNGNSVGLYLRYDPEHDRLWVCHGAFPHQRRLAYYDQQDFDLISDKLRIQYYADVEDTHLGGDAYAYTVHSVTARNFRFKRLTPSLFFDLVREGVLILELRAHICDDVACRIDRCTKWKSSGFGSVRDHNTCVRVNKKRVDDAFVLEPIA